MGSKSRGDGNYRNPCLKMHQPWASLLVYGIKRIEGRSWPSPITGRLWIHAAGKVPDPETIKAMEDFYRQIYALDGVTDLKFPEQYPVSRLLGCVVVVGSVKSEELASWEDVPQGIYRNCLYQTKCVDIKESITWKKGFLKEHLEVFVQLNHHYHLSFHYQTHETRYL